jgi:hypothetical protein
MKSNVRRHSPLILGIYFYIPILGEYPVTTAWRVLRLRMEEWPPTMEGSCEYIE